MIDCIAYLPTLQSNRRVFVVTIQKCKWSILKLGLLQFDLSHQYLYALLIFSFCEICNPEKYRVFVGYSPTPGRQVSGVSCKYYEIQLLPRLLLFVDQLYCILAKITGRASRLRDHKKNVSALYWVIAGYSPTPVRQVGAILCKYYYYCWIRITDFSCYLLFCFHALNFYNTKIQDKNKQS